ncbi:alpha-L-fucosidase [Lysobacter sp. CFH 32150]|uniref:alpha-L-fucosidase n=1 Tax=Lysobacter sp. CFH 32150 TaxID=2927128 RepID=UPI001FA6F6A8|nr:alpha-L-fucosidase [Lysobacter sp. CFH 32150]MCI4569122.1 alpha-L-fucosidase [Lysobacter sp. CFH 32150]
MKRWLVLLFGCLACVAQAAEPLPKADADARMQWFKDAKFGVFIHWGIYAVDGIDESWSFFNGYISHDDYLRQLQGFTANRYEPQQWAKLIKQSGARYAVLTTKHHDGVALWDAKQGITTKKDTPARRDLVGPFVDALRKQDLKVGLYYSLIDWSYPDYDGFLRDKKRYEVKDDPRRWARFVDFYQGQLKELSQRYDPDLYWFDGDWEHSAEEWQADKVRAMLLARNPDTILNSRLTGRGDYATPEQGVPIVKPADQYWELCLTMNDSWGYQPNDRAYKTPNQLIRVLADTISLGGNLLLDIGPRADGTIPEEQVAVLKEMGRWTSKHAEAIYGSEAGIPKDHYYGPSALSKDKTLLYLFLDGKPNGPVLVKGLKNKVHRSWVVGNGTKLKSTVLGKAYWSQVPGLLYIDVPEAVLDPQVTVIALLLDGPVDLYREEIKAIESN